MLEKDKFLEIHKQLNKWISALAGSGKTKVIFNELLTKTEKIMLAKRLSIILMLESEESEYAIKNTLKVSGSTVGRISDKFEKGDYEELLKEVKLQKSFWIQLQKIIPPKVGRNRFKHFLKF